MSEKQNWIDKFSETVDRAAKAANEAWDGTADLRKDTWEKTKTAASSASNALDQGIEQAKISFRGDDEVGQEEAQGQEGSQAEEAVAYDDEAGTDVM
jgi:hypothetical protein